MNELMMNVLMKLEPKYEIYDFKKSGDRVDENLEMELSTGRKIILKSVLDQAPLLLVFIKGTWCPFCRLHLQKLRTWAEKLKNKTTIIVVLSLFQVSRKRISIIGLKLIMSVTFL